MKKSTLIHSLLVAVLLTGSASSAVLAHEGISDSTSSTSIAQSETEVRRQAAEIVARRKLEAEHIRQAAEAKKVERLENAKKQQCQKIEVNINRHTQNFIDHVQRQLQVFDGISKKVQDFAAKKNLTVTQEATLLAQIQTAKAKVASALTDLQADSSAFKCDGTNPKGALKSFQTGAALVRTDLKSYRDAVRELIKAIRAANGESSTGVSQ